MSKNDFYPNLGSLKPIKRLLQKVSYALGDKSRTIHDSSIPDYLDAALDGNFGAVGRYAALYSLGITTGLAAGSLVGGGMIAGIGVLAAPVAILAVGGYAINKRRNERLIIKTKMSLLNEAMVKYSLLLTTLKECNDITEERTKYLAALVIRLYEAIDCLLQDLGYE